MDLVGPFAYVLESKITVLTMVSGGNVSTSSENTRNLKLQNSQLLGNGLVISIMRPTLLLEISSISVSDLFDLSFVILRSLLPHLFGLCFAISLPSNRALNFSSLQQRNDSHHPTNATVTISIAVLEERSWNEFLMLRL
ncbi:hypothetical protein DVH24_008390 [Malus domestica]|uniref:Uncharacterized protein n=1 Tax=Malus domestica TaxID=3750 RepID=A0A498JK13_MALDO|nr:hypothetical protein DVH24_008390 [Malus domestica]